MSSRFQRLLPWLAALVTAASCAEQPVDPAGERAVQPGQIPPVPFDLAALASQGAITLEWSVASPTGVTGYRVYRATGEEEFVLVGSPATTTFLDTDVVSGTTYLYEVASVRAGLEGGHSNTLLAHLNVPELLLPDVAPDFGQPPTVFQYQCTYRHPDNLPPTSVVVVVDGNQVFPMTQLGSGTSWAIGEIFRASANLPPGGHTFYFETVASDLSSARNPAAGFVFGGPVVSQGPEAGR